MKSNKVVVNVLLSIDIFLMILLIIGGIIGTIFSVREIVNIGEASDPDAGKIVLFSFLIILCICCSIFPFFSITASIVALVFYNTKDVTPIPVCITTMAIGGFPLGLIAGILMLVERRNINNHIY
jgi:hypothetical protein